MEDHERLREKAIAYLNKNRERKPSHKNAAHLRSISNEKLFSVEYEHFPGSAFERLIRWTIAIMNHNSQGSGDKIYLSLKMLQKISGCNQKTVGEFLEAIAPEIEGHHQTFSISYNKRRSTDWENIQPVDLS